MRDLILSVIISVLGVYVIAEYTIEQQKTPTSQCALSLQRSHETVHRFRSSTHARAWCSENIKTWRKQVTHATLLQYQQLTKAEN